MSCHADVVQDFLEEQLGVSDGAAAAEESDEDDEGSADDSDDDEEVWV